MKNVSFKARKQQEKPLHPKQENNLESIKKVSQNLRMQTKHENNKRNLSIKSKKTTLILSRICITKWKNSFKGRKQQEKPFHSKQENNLESTKNVSQN